MIKLFDRAARTCMRENPDDHPSHPSDAAVALSLTYAVCFHRMLLRSKLNHCRALRPAIPLCGVLLRSTLLH